jgi:hypothetical protein
MEEAGLKPQNRPDVSIHLVSSQSIPRCKRILFDTAPQTTPALQEAPT